MSRPRSDSSVSVTTSGPGRSRRVRRKTVVVGGYRPEVLFLSDLVPDYRSCPSGWPGTRRGVTSRTDPDGPGEGYVGRAV